jgi:hypothetical protein
MLGRIETSKVIELLLGVIIIAVVIGIYLMNVFAVCNTKNPIYCLLPHSEKARFISYATCALAKCQNGCDSEQVKDLCLEFDAGNNCKTWCKDTCKPNDKGTECKQENAISIKVNGAVFISSGDFQTYANWVCGWLDTNLPGGFTTFFGIKNFCVMSNACGTPQHAYQEYGTTPLVTANNLKCGDELPNLIMTSVSIPSTYATGHCTTNTPAGAPTQKLDSCNFISDDPTTNKEITYNFWANSWGFCSYLQICPSESELPTTTVTPVLETCEEHGGTCKVTCDFANSEQDIGIYNCPQGIKESPGKVCCAPITITTSTSVVSATS